jgi:hypothetical protein
MIKYLELADYINLGEIQTFSHVYQFMERNKSNPITILINAYVPDAKIFKGRVWNKSKSFEKIELSKDEKATIEHYTGNLNEVNFPDFIKNTVIEEPYSNFIEETQK